MTMGVLTELKSRKTVFIIFYIGLLILAFEVLCRFFLSLDIVIDTISGIDDSSCRLKWVSRHKDNIAIYYKFDIYDRTKGWISKPNLRNESVFDNKILNTNSSGFRGQVDYHNVKDQKRTRIVILGDSYTFGDEVSDNETYSHYLQELLPETEIVNLGVHGYGHDQMLILFKENQEELNPDIVILGFVYIDIYRNGLKFNDYSKPKFELDSGNLLLKNSPVPNPEIVLKSEWMRLKFIDLLRITHHRIINKLGIYKQRTERVTTNILNELISEILESGAKPVFFYLPIEDEIILADKSASRQKFFFNYCDNNKKVECFSVLSNFTRKLKAGTQFNLSGHWGAIGNFTIAEEIRNYLLSEGYVKNNRNRR